MRLRLGLVVAVAAGALMPIGIATPGSASATSTQCEFGPQTNIKYVVGGTDYSDRGIAPLIYHPQTASVSVTDRRVSFIVTVPDFERMLPLSAASAIMPVDPTAMFWITDATGRKRINIAWRPPSEVSAYALKPSTKDRPIRGARAQVLGSTLIFSVPLRQLPVALPRDFRWAAVLLQLSQTEEDRLPILHMSEAWCPAGLAGSDGGKRFQTDDLAGGKTPSTTSPVTTPASTSPSVTAPTPSTAGEPDCSVQTVEAVARMNGAIPPDSPVLMIRCSAAYDGRELAGITFVGPSNSPNYLVLLQWSGDRWQLASSATDWITVSNQTGLSRAELSNLFPNDVGRGA